MSYNIQLPIFEGPFDLLLHLIKENELDIYDIPIAEITAQYLDYLQAMEEMDLEIASSFIVMAATLLAIKAKMLLPPAEGEDEEDGFEDARGELVRDLLEYMRFKEAAQQMSLLHDAEKNYFHRYNEAEMYANLFSAENPLSGKTLIDLQAAFSKVIQKAKPEDALLYIEREQITLQDRLDHVYALMLKVKKAMAFSQVFDGCVSRIEYIITFLAILELARQGVIKLSQSGNYNEIYLQLGDLKKYERVL